MDIPLDASVECSDGPVGTLTNIIVNPATETITHLVVSEHGLVGSKRLLSEALVKESTHRYHFFVHQQKGVPGTGKICANRVPSLGRPCLYE